MFFSKFDTISYDNKDIRDLSQAIIIRPEIKENKDLFFYYELEEGERPETVAFDFYGSSHYNYVFLLMNDIVDPFFDWPLERNELIALCEERYGAPGIVNGQYDQTGYYAVRHWEKDGIFYQEEFKPVGSVAVSYIEYEERLNDAKRRVKVLYPELIARLDKELELLLNG
jgi:hypothetical protein